MLKDEFVQEKMDEMARLFYSNDSVTINLYWAAAAALLTLLCKIFFLFFVFLSFIQCFRVPPDLITDLLVSADPAVVAALPARCLHGWVRLWRPLSGLWRPRGELWRPRPRIRRPQLQQKCEY